jgi:hypothetical protein
LNESVRILADYVDLANRSNVQSIGGAR